MPVGISSSWFCIACVPATQLLSLGTWIISVVWSLTPVLECSLSLWHCVCFYHGIFPLYCVCMGRFWYWEGYARSFPTEPMPPIPRWAHCWPRLSQSVMVIKSLWQQSHHQKQHGQQIEGGDSAPLLCSGETWAGVMHPVLRPQTQRQPWPVGMSPDKATKLITV